VSPCSALRRSLCCEELLQLWEQVSLALLAVLGRLMAHIGRLVLIRGVESNSILGGDSIERSVFSAMASDCASSCRLWGWQQLRQAQ